MKYLIVLIFLGIVIESIFVVHGQQLNSDNDDDERQTTSILNADNNGNIRRPTANLNGKHKRVLKVRKDNQQSLPVAGKRLNRPSLADSEVDSVPASSIKKSFTVNNYDENDDDYFSRRRARFLFRQRVGK